MKYKIKIVPSLLAADFGALGAEALRAQDAGADALHIDIMDGHFVPNLSMGPDVVAMAKRTVTIPLNVHLMITNPDKMADTFLDAGADALMIHIETECDARAALEHIKSRGCRPGITLNPDTPAEDVFPVLDIADEVLCMTVRPGYGGQAFMPEVLPKIRAIRDELERLGRVADVMVDGGINPDTAAECASHGANSFSAGSSLFRADDMAGELARMRQLIESAAS